MSKNVAKVGICCKVKKCRESNNVENVNIYLKSRKRLLKSKNLEKSKNVAKVEKSCKQC